MYLVRFVRRDRQPDEEYFYNNRQDADHHLNLFRDDDSDLYCRIELLRVAGPLETVIETIRF